MTTADIQLAIEVEDIDMIERQFIGELLFSSERVVSLGREKELLPSDFKQLRLGRVWGSALSVWEAQQMCDCVMILADIAARGFIKTGADEVWYRQLMDEGQILSHVPWYISLIIERGRNRILHSQILDELNATDSGDTSELKARLKHVIDQADDGPSPLTTAADIARDMRENPEQYEGLRIPTGIYQWDNMVGHLHKGGVHVISGYKGSCKTTLMLRILCNIALTGEKVGVITLEQDYSQITKTLETWLGVDSPAMRNITVTDQPRTPEAISAHTERLSRDGAVAVGIDYFQKIREGHRTFSNDVSRLDFCTQTIMDAAKMYKIAILAISTLSREGKLRGTGQLEYDPFVIGICEKKDRTGSAIDIDVVIDKNRFGPADIVLELTIDPVTGHCGMRGSTGRPYTPADDPINDNQGG